MFLFRVMLTVKLKLQQERRKITADYEESKRERDAALKETEQMRKEIGSLRSQLEETEWGLCQKSGTIQISCLEKSN